MITLLKVPFGFAVLAVALCIAAVIGILCVSDATLERITTDSEEL